MSAASLLRKVPVTKPVVPAYENFRFDVEGGWMTVTASDGETTVSVRREVTVKDEGVPCSFLVSPVFVYDALKGLSYQRIDISVTGGRMDLDWDEGHVSVPVLDTCDWPAEAEVKGALETGFVCSDDLTRGLALVDFACCKDDARPLMCGVALSFLGKKGGARVVASDAHMLSVANIAGGTSFRAFDVVVPRRTVAMVRRFFPLGEDLVIERDDNTVVFKAEDAGIVVRGRLLEGKYPKWESVVPANWNFHAGVSRAKLLGVIERQGACAGPGRTLTMDFESHKLTVSSHDLGMGVEGQEYLSCDLKGEGAVSVSFRHDRVKAIVESMPGVKLDISIIDASSAVVFRDADEKAKKGKKGEGNAENATDARGRGDRIEVFSLVMPVKDGAAEL